MILRENRSIFLFLLNCLSLGHVVALLDAVWAGTRAQTSFEVEVIDTVVGCLPHHGTPIHLTLSDDREFGLLLPDGILVLTLKPLLDELVSLVIQLVRFFFLPIFVDGRHCLFAKHLLGVCILIKLENEFVNFLSADPPLTLLGLGLDLELMQLGLQIGDVAIFVLDLIFLHSEQSLHALVLVLQSNHLRVAFLEVVEELAELFFRLLRVLFLFSSYQGALVFKMIHSFLNELAAGVKGSDLASLSLEKPVVEIDQSLILHLAVAAIARAVLSLVLLAQLDLVKRTILTD